MQPLLVSPRWSSLMTRGSWLEAGSLSCGQVAERTALDVSSPISYAGACSGPMAVTFHDALGAHVLPTATRSPTFSSRRFVQPLPTTNTSRSVTRYRQLVASNAT